MATIPPHWDLSNVYSGLDSPELAKDIEWVKAETESLSEVYKEEWAKVTPDSPLEAINEAISMMVDKTNPLWETALTINAYLHSFMATDSFDQKALQMGSQYDMVLVNIQKVFVVIEAWIGKFKAQLPEVFALGNSAGEHAFPIKELAEQSQYLMSEKEEILSNELSLSGARSWTKLQGTITSQKTVDFELDGEMKKLPMPALINLHSHPEVKEERRIKLLEMSAWESIKEPLAACMNGVKGWANTINGHRGRKDALHAPIDQARIDRETLEVMMEAMKESFPTFRRYYKAKAARFGQDALPWWNVFAPVGKLEKQFSFSEAKEFILKHFGDFSPELRAFAKTAFENRWIDAEQRPGKRGGAFCMGVPGVKESRILCNFDGTLDQVMTIAHELGHGYHNFNMYQANKTPLQRDTPMTMAETASIMC